MNASAIEAAAKEYRAALTENLNIIASALEEYPALKRALTSKDKLYSLIEHIRNAQAYAVIEDATGVVWYAVEIRALAARYGGSIKTWHRLIVLCEIWGLLRRDHTGTRSINAAIRAAAARAAANHTHPVTWYYVPPWTHSTLTNADALAAAWNQRGRAAGFGKGSVIAVYGQTAADQAYGDTRTDTKDQRERQARIDAAARDAISERGYAYKNELIDADSQADVAAFNRWRSAHAEYKYAPPTRAQREALNLLSTRWIITSV